MSINFITNINKQKQKKVLEFSNPVEPDLLQHLIFLHTFIQSQKPQL